MLEADDTDEEIDKMHEMFNSIFDLVTKLKNVCCGASPETHAA